MSLAGERRDLEDRIWEALAYGARYGKQPLSELRRLPMHELSRFNSELSKIVVDEKTPARS